MAQPFISLDDLTAYLGYDPEQERATIALDTACQVVRDHVGQAVDRVADDVVELDSEGTDTILLPELPVVSVASVVGPGGVELSADMDYRLDPEMGALVTRGRWRRFLRGRGIYTVTYTHGWDTVPSSVRGVALELAARVYDQQLVKQETAGAYGVTYAADAALMLTDGERAILAKHSPGRRR